MVSSAEQWRANGAHKDIQCIIKCIITTQMNYYYSIRIELRIPSTVHEQARNAGPFEPFTTMAGAWMAALLPPLTDPSNLPRAYFVALCACALFRHQSGGVYHFIAAMNAQ